MLTSVGAKTGKLRKTALMRVEHDGEYAVVASKGGARRPPRLVPEPQAKHPHVELQDGGQKHDYEAREATGAEKAEWWQRALEVWPDYGRYQQRTDREIPLFVLTRIVT